MGTVFANGRSIVHKGDGQTNIAAPPDVCKTPSPAGPVPIPYVNIAQNSNLASGTTKVKIEGNAVGLENSNLSTSTGDEPGTAGGILSSKFKGKMTWGSSSLDVKFEGKGVVRFLDVVQHNGNSFNTAFIEMGGTGFAYGDDFAGLCPICNENPNKHAVLEKPKGSLETTMKILDDLKACEKLWVDANTRVEAADTKLEKDIRLNPSMKPETIATRRAAIVALAEARDALASHRRPDSRGYMFGVMVCLTGKKFAAVSGVETPSKFESIAASHGCTVIKDAATLNDFIAANPRAADGNAPAIAALTDGFAAAMAKHDSAVDGYNNKPGTCAGAKLIGKSGHIADSMTEFYFAFKIGKNALSTLAFSAIYRGPGALGPVSPAAFVAPTAVEYASPLVDERRDMKRKVGETVPSCQSCQDTLFVAMCDKEGRSCG
ncbi:MAG: DUF4150 domain-containing protein [Planctomycetota bacterium]